MRSGFVRLVALRLHYSRRRILGEELAANCRFLILPLGVAMWNRYKHFCLQIWSDTYSLVHLKHTESLSICITFIPLLTPPTVRPNRSDSLTKLLTVLMHSYQLTVLVLMYAFEHVTVKYQPVANPSMVQRFESIKNKLLRLD